MTSGKTFEKDPIDFMRFLCISLMFFAHYNTDHFGPPGAFDSIAATLYEIFNGGLSRASSPFLGIVSGYFVYHQLNRHGYAKTIKKRFFTLYVPTVKYSIIYIVIAAPIFYVVNRELMPFLAGDFWVLFNRVVPIWLTPGNFPLHYLVDLFKLCLVAPLFIWVLNRMPLSLKVALVLLIAFVPNSLIDPGNGTNILPRWDLLTFFVVGLVIASEELSLTKLMERRIGAVLFAASLVFIVLVGPLWLGYLRSDLFWERYLGYLLLTALKVAGVLFALALAQRLIKITWMHRFVPERQVIFTAFCIHWIVLFFLVRIPGLAAPFVADTTPVVLLSFFLLPVVTFAIAIILHRIGAWWRGPSSDPAPS